MKRKAPHISRAQLLKFAQECRLSPRETELVEHIAGGVESNRDLAERMGVTLLSAKNYVHSVYGKTRTRSKLELFITLLNTSYGER